MQLTEMWMVWYAFCRSNNRGIFQLGLTICCVQSPLLLACRLNDVETIKIILKQAVNLEEKDKVCTFAFVLVFISCLVGWIHTIVYCCEKRQQ